MRAAFWFVAVAGLTSLAIAGCAASKDQLLKRAAFDLHCTKDEIRISKLDRRTRGVRGCGWQATYVESCNQMPNGMTTDCTWVLNDKQREDE